MTDFEMSYLVLEQVSIAFTVLATYVSIVFAFLVAGYLVAHKLASSMVAILITLFTMISMMVAGIAVRAGRGISGLEEEIRRAVAEGRSSLSWNASALADSGGSAMSTLIPLIFASIIIIAYIGALWFFFHQRQVGLKQVSA